MVKTLDKVKSYAQESDIWPDAAYALEESLKQISGAKVSTILTPVLPEGNRPDLLAHLTYAEHQVTLIGEVKKIGEPQHARAAFYQLNRYLNALPGAIGMFIAPYISPETAKLCQDEDISYQDLAGNCHIAFDGVYIHVEGKPNPFAQSRPLRSLYQPKAERVLRVLLTHPSKPWLIQALAEEAKVSVGQVFKVKELLREKAWLAETNWGAQRGVQLSKPIELLTDWAEHYRFSKHQDAQFYTLSNIDAFGQALSMECQRRKIPCAFTSFAAAARYAPYATYRRTTAYVHHELAEVQELLKLPPLQLAPVETGADVILLSPYDDGVFYGARQEQDMSLASPLQTYLDLQSAGGRGIEAAEELLQKEIVPNW